MSFGGQCLVKSTAEYSILRVGEEDQHQSILGIALYMPHDYIVTSYAAISASKRNE
jgi:hypothetical protein